MKEAPKRHYTYPQMSCSLAILRLQCAAMKHLSLAILLCCFGFAQEPFSPLPKESAATPVQAVKPSPPTNDPLRLSNYHVLLTPSSAPGMEEPMWLAIAPDGSLNILPVSELQARFSHGYRPCTFGELREELRSLVTTNASLTDELQRLRSSTASQTSVAPVQQGPTQAELMQAEAQRRKDMQRQAMIMFLLGQRPQTVNVNVCDRTKAVCPY